MSKKGFNSIALEILWGRLIAITDEMGATLHRTAFSTSAREGKDFTCVLLDAAGDSIAQLTRSVAAFSGVLPITTKHFLDAYPPDTLKPGDVLVTNDPWLASGHLPDITTVAPVFSNEKLVAFVGVVTHLPDIGGKQLSSDASEVFEEGLQIPMSKLYKEGKPNKDLFNIIEHNVRVPDQVFGDLRAHVAAHDTGAKKLLELMGEADLRDLSLLAQTIQDVSERAMRKAISGIPDGDYHYEVYGDGFEELVRIKVKVSVKGDNIVVDYEGSSPQNPRGINAPLNHTYAYTMYAIKCALSPNIPNNEGFFKPIKVQAPQGCILNAQPPAAVGGRHIVGQILPGAVFGALAPVLPEKIQAEYASPNWVLCLHGQQDDGESFVILPLLHGGQGAGKRQDGLPCIAFPSNSSDIPVEIIENQVPLLIKEKSMAVDSGGPGCFRGGCGEKYDIQLDSPYPIKLTAFVDKTKVAASGLFDGCSGASGSIKLNGKILADPKEERFLQPGDCLELITPGGGGFGDPLERAVERVLADVFYGYVSLEQSEKEYGVIIDPTDWSVKGLSPKRLKRGESNVKGVSRGSGG
jgi:N-methylhydantoinase B